MGGERWSHGGANLPLELPLFLGSIVSENFKAGAPTLQFHLPVQHHTGGDNDQMRTPVTCLAKECEMCNMVTIALYCIIWKLLRS